MSIVEKTSFIKPEINERIGTLKLFSFAKNRDSETALSKNRDCGAHITAKKRESETREIRLKFCETQSFWRTIRHPFNLRVIFQNTRRIKSFFPYKDRLNRSQKSKIVYKGSCWDSDAFYIGKTRRRLHDRKTEHLKALTQVDHALIRCCWSFHRQPRRWIRLIRDIILLAIALQF